MCGCVRLCACLSFSLSLCVQPIPSLLHLAAKAHNEVLVRLFLEFGLDTSLRDENGRTPIHAAMGYGPASPRFTRLLLDLGADATAIDDQGQTVFHYLFNVRRRHIDRSADTHLHL